MAKYFVNEDRNERRLAHHAGCQCKVRTHLDGTIEFISYSTVVIIATPLKNHPDIKDKDILVPVDDFDHEEGYILECTGTYSATTRKQIGYFLKEYFGDVSYYHMRDIVGENTVVLAQRKHAKYW